MDFPGENAGGRCHFRLQGILPTPGSYLHLPALAGGFLALYIQPLFFRFLPQLGPHEHRGVPSCAGCPSSVTCVTQRCACVEARLPAHPPPPPCLVTVLWFLTRLCLVALQCPSSGPTGSLDHHLKQTLDFALFLCPIKAPKLKLNFGPILEKVLKASAAFSTLLTLLGFCFHLNVDNHILTNPTACEYTHTKMFFKKLYPAFRVVFIGKAEQGPWFAELPDDQLVQAERTWCRCYCLCIS